MKGAAIQEMVAKNKIAGAVPVLVTKDEFIHFESTCLADVAAKGLMIALTPPAAPGILRP